MSVSLSLLVVAGVFIACGIYMVLERTLSRIIMGLVLFGNGVNLLFLAALGRPAKAPFQGDAPASEMSDPLPMALVLTAIVISLAVTGFGMALSYRSWQVFGHDEVPDDVEDMRIAKRSKRMSAKAKARQAALAAHTQLAAASVSAEAATETAEELAELLAEDEVSDDLSSDIAVAFDLTEADASDLAIEITGTHDDAAASAKPETKPENASKAAPKSRSNLEERND